MPTSLLKRLINRAAAARPGDPQTICGSIAPGERVDIGPLRAVNDGGDLVLRHLVHDGVLRWSIAGADAETSISNLGNRPDEGVIFSRFGPDGSWAFVATVRPERCVVLHPVMCDIPVCRFGPGGDFVHDWPDSGDNGQLTVDSGDQAAGLKHSSAESPA